MVHRFALSSPGNSSAATRRSPGNFHVEKKVRLVPPRPWFRTVEKHRPAASRTTGLHEIRQFGFSSVLSGSVQVGLLLPAPAAGGARAGQWHCPWLDYCRGSASRADVDYDFATNPVMDVGHDISSRASAVCGRKGDHLADSWAGGQRRVLGEDDVVLRSTEVDEVIRLRQRTRDVAVWCVHVRRRLCGRRGRFRGHPGARADSAGRGG